MNIVFFNNNLSGMVHFRYEVMQKFLEKGFPVCVVAPDTGGGNTSWKSELPQGVEYIPIQMDRTSTNPLKDFKLLVAFYCILKNKRPCYLFNYTIKPNIYGAFAAKLLGVKCVDMIAGMGYAFTNDNLSSKTARLLYKVAGRCVEKIVVLNKSNYDAVLNLGICPKSKLHLFVGGEGIDLNKFPVYNNNSNVCRFVYIGRLIKAKGYNEYVGVAKRIHLQYPEVEFHLVGALDKEHPTAISSDQLAKDIQEAGIIYHQYVRDMSTIYSMHGVVLVIPSYYSEGLNRSLMEGCASGKPIITTDWPGCKEMVREGENGFLVEPHNVESLEKAIKEYLSLDSKRKEDFSKKSRDIAETNFRIETVVDYYEELVVNSLSTPIGDN